MSKDKPSKSKVKAARPKKGDEILTACGSRVHYAKDTPRAEFQGQVVYFCLKLCKDDFDRDPTSSCLAIALGKQV